MTDLTAAVHGYLTTAPTSHFLGCAVAVVDHWQGDDNLLWRVRCGSQDAVLKLFLDAGQARSRRHFDGQQMFAPMALAPAPLWVDRYPAGLARQVLIYQWLPGAAPSPVDRRTVLEVAQAAAHVHAADPLAVRRLCPHPVSLDFFWRIVVAGVPPLQRWLDALAVHEVSARLADLADRAAAQVRTGLPLWEQAPPTPVHGDLRLQNCITGPDGVALLDWEFFGLGDPALEVASWLYHSQPLLDEQIQAAWLEAYLLAAGAPGLDRRIAVYRRLLPFRDLCFLLAGLHTAASRPDAQAELAEGADFLRATLTALLDRAGRELDAEWQVPAATLTNELFATLNMV